MKDILPPIFVLNLPKNAPRRQAMQDRADQAGFKIEFLEGVDGKTLTQEQLAFYDGKKRRKYFGRDLLPGEIGCLLAHRGAYEKMARESIPVAVILEDDVIFEPDAREVFEALPSSPVRWDVVRFLGSTKIYKRGSRSIAPLTGRYALARLPTTPGGAHGYMIRLEAAKTMLRHMQKNWLPIDTLQGRSWETGLETLVVKPAPLYPNEAEASTIGDQRFDKTVQLQGLGHLAFPFNRAFFKFQETLGKKYIYLSSWLRDNRKF